MSGDVPYILYTDSWRFAVANALRAARNTGLRYRVRSAWAPYGNPWRIWVAQPVTT